MGGRRAYALALGLVGCAATSSDDEGADGGFGDGGSGGAGTATAESSAGSANDDDDDDDDAADDDDDDDETGGDLKLDVGAATTGALPEAGCQKIDFLFVIDNSESMVDEQAALAASFDGFIDAIVETLNVEDYHVMVVDTDGSPYLEGCDGVLGAGRVTSGAGKDCAIAGDQRYMTVDQPDYAEAFSCVALVGATGSGKEHIMEALFESITTLSQPGECNAGFLRDDAILVVTVIADEGDFVTPGTPQDWHDTVVAAKQGQEDAVVPLGIISDLGKEGAPCTVVGGANTNAPFIEMFIDSFEHGRRHSVCDPPYDDFFLEAVTSVELSCESFEPQG